MVYTAVYQVTLAGIASMSDQGLQWSGGRGSGLFVVRRTWIGELVKKILLTERARYLLKLSRRLIEIEAIPGGIRSAGIAE
jgi:hypothetical protein